LVPECRIGEPGSRSHPTFDVIRPLSRGIRHLTDPPGGPMADFGDHDDDLGGGMDTRLRWLLAVALLSIIVGGTADLVMDDPETWLSFHVVFEMLMIAGALLMATTLWLGWWRSAHAAAALEVRLAEQAAERDRWRSSSQEALEGLGRAIDAQFDDWHLTPAEREVALLVLKGYGHKQIAALTGRSERTARQHAGTVYEKAGLGGRAELSAYFLQDLMLPEAEREVLQTNGPVDAASR
jgi:DNA-binding CsgD family transcriptional regulator